MRGFVRDAIGFGHGAIAHLPVGGVGELLEQRNAGSAHAFGQGSIEETGRLRDAELDVMAQVGVNGGEELLIFGGGPVGVKPAAKFLRHAPDCSLRRLLLP